MRGLRRTFCKIFKRPMKVGLALGGGNSRGVAHAGVLKVLVENKIPIDFIAATSSGAIPGALFVGGMNVYDIIKQARTNDWLTKVSRITFNAVWPISVEGVAQYLIKHLGDKKIEELRIPFATVATDYKTGEKVVLKKGKLAKNVQASSALPGIYAPVEIDGGLLMDGLMVDNVPADVVRNMGADYVIAVDVVPDIILKENPKNVRQIVERAIDISSREQSRASFYKYADVVISPVRENVSPLDFNRADELIRWGEEAANKVIGKIKKDLGVL